MPELNQRLAKAVLKRRESRGWSQADVAANGGPSDTTQGKIEAGRGSVGTKTLAQIDAGLGWDAGTAAQLLSEGHAAGFLNRHPSRHQLMGSMEEVSAWVEAVLETGVIGEPPQSLLRAYTNGQIADEVRGRLERQRREIEQWMERSTMEGDQDAGQAEDEKSGVEGRVDVIHLSDAITFELPAGADVPVDLLDQLAAYNPGIPGGRVIPEQERAGEENQDPDDEG